MTLSRNACERSSTYAICHGKDIIAFCKYSALHKLEVRHGVDLGFAYKTKDSAKNFTHIIAKRQCQEFLHTSLAASFYSFLMDGSTDAGNVEDELIAILYCFKYDVTQEVRLCVRYFLLEVLTKADADGLLSCLGDTLKPLGIDNILDKANILGVEGKPILVGGGTDGTSVNIAEHNGMRGKMTKELPWLVWTWCYAH